ncbi:hypothetical protein [Streptomyces sp. NPDC058045]|uniref:hypothetical protein n=1 Tax=Streptomyces sp. NPDC058045 TaxID=3346311 RepID=UPI0036EB8A50
MRRSVFALRTAGAAAVLAAAPSAAAAAGGLPAHPQTTVAAPAARHGTSATARAEMIGQSRGDSDRDAPRTGPGMPQAVTGLVLAAVVGVLFTIRGVRGRRRGRRDRVAR